MAAMNTNRERGEATRRHIVEVALRLFSVDGYHATSIEAILSTSGLSRGAFYHHFKNKEQVFEAAFLVVEQEVTRLSIEHSEHISDPQERLRSGCRTFIEIASRGHFRQVGLIDAPAVLGWQRWRELEEQYGLGVLRKGLNAAAQTRGGSKELPEESARLLLAALIEATMIVARANEPAKALAGCEMAIQKMLTALLVF
jgi:AcrR family transcriptional regulator